MTDLIWSLSPWLLFLLATRFTSQLCGTPGFRAVNRTISLVWGLAFLVGTVSLIVAGSVTGRPFLLRILIPFGALAWAYSYTQR